MRRLNYRGNIAAKVVFRVLGPDLFGAMWRIEAAVYDPTADLTRCTLVPAPRPLAVSR